MTPENHPARSLAQPVNVPTIDASGYMHALVKTVRDAELTLIKNLEKVQGLAAAPPRRRSTRKNFRAVRVYVAMRFPERRDA